MRGAPGRILALLLVGSALFSCQRASEALDLTVGVIYPATGPYSKAVGDQTRNGILLARDFAERTHPLKNRGHDLNLRIDFEDDKNLPEEGVFTARKLINQKNVSVLIGAPLSQVALPVGLVAEAKRVPFISTMGSHPALTYGKGYVFRINPGISSRAVALARFARTTLGLQVAGTVFDTSNPYSKAAALSFKAEWIKQGGVWIPGASHEPDVTDFVDVLAALSRQGAQTIFLPDYDPAISREMAAWPSPNVVPLGMDGLALDLRTKVWPQKLYFASGEVPGAGSPGMDDFTNAYRSHFGAEPNVAAATAYDAFLYFWAALARTEDWDAQGIAASLRSITDFKGITGTLHFAGSGTPNVESQVYSYSIPGSLRRESTGNEP